MELVEVVARPELIGADRNKSRKNGGPRVESAKLAGGVKEFGDGFGLQGSAHDGAPSFDIQGVEVSPERGSGFQATIVQSFLDGCSAVPASSSSSVCSDVFARFSSVSWGSVEGKWLKGHESHCLCLNR